MIISISDLTTKHKKNHWNSSTMNLSRFLRSCISEVIFLTSFRYFSLFLSPSSSSSLSIPDTLASMTCYFLSMKASLMSASSTPIKASRVFGFIWYFCIFCSIVSIFSCFSRKPYFCSSSCLTLHKSCLFYSMRDWLSAAIDWILLSITNILP